MRLEQLLVTNGYSKEDLIIVSVPTADQVSVMVSSASLIAESNSYQEAGRKSSISDGQLRKVSTSSMEKKVSFDRGVSIQEEEDVKPDEVFEDEVKPIEAKQDETDAEDINKVEQR